MAGFGAEVGPSHVVCGPAYFSTADLAAATPSSAAEAAEPSGIRPASIIVLNTLHDVDRIVLSLVAAASLGAVVAALSPKPNVLVNT